MTEQMQLEAMGEPNPHYKPSIMQWNNITIALPEGWEAGVIGEHTGAITLTVRPPGGEWPHGIAPMKGSTNTIGEGSRYFEVYNDERGPARDHEFEPMPDNPELCEICASRSMGQSMRSNDDGLSEAAK